MKNTLLSLFFLLVSFSFTNAQNLDSFTVSKDTVIVCDQSVTLTNHSTNFDSIRWIIQQLPSWIDQSKLTNTIQQIYLFDTGCHDIKLFIWRGGQYDSIVKYCAVFGVYHELITLNGNSIDTVDVFKTYVDPGYTVFDNCIGIDFSKCSTISTVNQYIVGKYIIKYIVVNHAGRSDTAIRTVHVVDRIAPAIALVGPDTMYSDKSCRFIDPGVSISDNYYANVISSTTNNIDSSIIGTYEIIYWAIDGSGNSSDTVKRVVIIQDINPPELVADTAYVEVYHAYKPNIIFNHECCTLAECDIYIGGNVDTSHLGTYTSQIWIQDCVGNITDTITQIVIVGDTTPPHIKWIDGYSYYQITYRFDTLDVNPYEAVEVIDNYDSNLYADLSGSYFTEYLKYYYDGIYKNGLYNIVINSKDVSGNNADMVFILIYVYCISIEEINNSHLNIFPNPNSGHFTIENKNLNQILNSISIFNQMGQEVYFKEIDDQLVHQIEIDLKQPAGLYFILVKSAKSTITYKVLLE